MSEFDRESIDWKTVEEEALEFFESKNFHVLIGVVDPVNDQEVLKSGVFEEVCRTYLSRTNPSRRLGCFRSLKEYSIRKRAAVLEGC